MSRKIRIHNELHKIQDRRGYLPAEELKALSARAESLGERLPLHRLHEVASFFPHYRLEPPAGLEVKVCRDMTCHLRGAPGLRARLEEVAKEIGGGRVKVEGVSCLGQCDSAPAILVADHSYWGKTTREYEDLVRAAVAPATPPAPQRTGASAPPDWKIDVYRHERNAPYQPYQAIQDFLLPPDGADESEALGQAAGTGVIEALELANLRGMGGAGTPAHEKWTDVRDARMDKRIDEKFVVCNADESEPGTFKDRELLLRVPHLVIEGVILAGLVVGARRGYIYIRHEYQEQIEAVERELERARALGACGDNLLGTGQSMQVEVYVSPGGYICGEQSALIEAMEEKRAEPRNKPPELATNGLWDKPTLLSNVETFAWVPAIVLRGGPWYRDQGVNGGKGLRFFSISGDVASPGVFEVPIGTPLGALIEQAGGMRGGKALKAVAPSGPSGGFLPATIPVPSKPRFPEGFPAGRIAAGLARRDLLDMELDLDLFRAFGLMLGAGIVVYAEGEDMADHARNCTEFFRNESCGKCVPCRLGSERLVQLAAEIQTGSAGPERLDEIEDWVGELRESLQQTSICGLGAVAAEPLAMAFQFFRADVDRHVSRTDPTTPPEPTR